MPEAHNCPQDRPISSWSKSHRKIDRDIRWIKLRGYAQPVVIVVLVAGIVYAGLGGAVLGNDTPGTIVNYGDGNADSAFSGTEDADNDGIPDQWERQGETSSGAPLPDAAVGTRDVYVVINPSGDFARPPDEVLAGVKNLYANVDIAVHFIPGEPITEEVESQSDGATADYYRTPYVPETCLYHQMVLGPVSSESGIDPAGRADSPGYIMWVDPRKVQSQRQYVTLVAHELGHNLIGGYDDGGYHTDSGIMAVRSSEAEWSVASTRELRGGLATVEEEVPSC